MSKDAKRTLNDLLSLAALSGANIEIIKSLIEKYKKECCWDDDTAIEYIYNKFISGNIDNSIWVNKFNKGE